MASLHRDKRTGIIYVSYRTPAGQRFRSTHTKGCRAAEAFARGIERALQKSRMQQLTAEAAREIISEIYEQSSGEPLKIHTMEAWANEWLEGKKSGSAGTFAKNSATIRAFLWSLQERAKLCINQILKPDVEKFRAERQRAKLSNSTVNDHLNILTGCFCRGTTPRAHYL